MSENQRGFLDFIISRIPGILPREKIKLAGELDHEAEILLLSKKDIERKLARTIKGPNFFLKDIRAEGEADWLNARKRGMGVVSWRDDAYPFLLKEISDPPLLLYYRGSLPPPEKETAAVVGTRRPSPPCASAAYAVSRDLSRAGIAVVSGLALGIDAMAHRGAVEGGGVTLAVLGSGVDSVYPASNRALARRILENGGALVSEYPPGTPPRKWNFPARNRIVAGLCRAVIVVEAPLNSGALITARFALDENRELWVTKAGLASPLGEGIRGLEAQGASVLDSAASLLAEWNYDIPEEKPGDEEGELGRALARTLNIALEGRS